MQAKQINFNLRGMQRDLSVSKFNPEYSYENMNLRFTVDKDNTLLSIVNEKGPSQVQLKDTLGEDFLIEGLYLGSAVLNNIITIFTKGEADNIYRVIYNAEDDNFQIELLFTGILNFNKDYPIETTSVYENEDIQKVYWLDGLNQPRFINIAPTVDTSLFTNNSFDFSQALDLKEVIEIEKNTDGSGVFAPGVIQYAFSYFNRYGQESNIFHTTPLNYISQSQRGVSPEDSVSNSFTIKLSNLDRHFDHVRIYSIHRSSLDATPLTKKVADVSLKESINLNTTFLSTVLSYTFLSNNIGDMMIYRNKGFIPIQGFPFTQTSDPLTGDILKTWQIPLDPSDMIVNRYGSYKVAVNSIFHQDALITLRLQNSGTSTISIRYVEGGQFNLYNYTISPAPERDAVYVDNGTTGEDISPDELLFKGSEEISASTFAQKDNTLFLGNLKLLRNKIPERVKDQFRSHYLTFNNTTEGRDISINTHSGFYPYESQLNKNSSEIKGFKYLDWYRFGVQFQHRTGKWSEPIFVGDYKNYTPIKVFDELKKVVIPSAVLSFNDYNVVNELISLGYKRARGVVVLPDSSSREVVAQGVLMPTVFNVKDREQGAPFAMSSWFSRPNSPFDYHVGLQDTSPLDPTSTYSRRDFLLDVGTKDGSSLVEHRHYYPIGGYTSKKGEIQSVKNAPISPLLNNFNDKENFIKNQGEAFYIDQSILTFHSPEIEFNESLKNLDSTTLKMRIVGAVPITSSASSIYVSSKGATYSQSTQEQFRILAERLGAASGLSVSHHFKTSGGSGFYEKSPSFNQLHRGAARGLSAGVNWFDAIYGSQNLVTGFAVYPWNRSSSLNNQNKLEDSDDESNTLYSIIESNKRSNLKFSFNSIYLDRDSVWDSSDNIDSNGITGITVFNSNELTMVKLPSQDPLHNEEITYYGNADKIVSPTASGDTENGYRIMVSSQGANVVLEAGEYEKDLQFLTTGNERVSDPVHMRYKSSPHAVLALRNHADGGQVILPTTLDYGNLKVNEIFKQGNVPFWYKNNQSPPQIHQSLIETESIKGNTQNIGYGYFWLAEIYNDNIQNRFGGDSENAIENNLWVPSGEAVDLESPGGGAAYPLKIVYTEGDTYYQRYDCLKTYPASQEDVNNVTEIVSFMCETRENIDGRYDRNRGQRRNLSLSLENFNLFNRAYSQSNNFFNYRSLNTSRVQPDNFKNIITWTKQKTLGEITDSWANITLASTLDMDGDKGEVRALRRFNNEIFSFQDRALARILFNSRVQVNASDGVPIEIANSYKVDGKVYLGQQIGTMNKWSIKSTPNGLYFIDDFNKSLFWFNGESAQSLSDAKGFRTFISKESGNREWMPEDFNNFITHYDSANRDLYFINKNKALCYSESLGEFTSFYDYESIPLMFNGGKKNFMLKEQKLWEQYGGDYNNFFGKIKPFYTTVIVNPEQNLDKIFNTVEYRADTFDDGVLLHNKTFDKLDIWNEYQRGSSSLSDIYGKSSALKKKFRIWRANIPRDQVNGRDRIRNPWAYLKLSMEDPGTTRTELHDLQVTYFS